MNFIKNMFSVLQKNNSLLTKIKSKDEISYNNSLDESKLSNEIYKLNNSTDENFTSDTSSECLNISTSQLNIDINRTNVESSAYICDLEEEVINLDDIFDDEVGIDKSMHEYINESSQGCGLVIKHDLSEQSDVNSDINLIEDKSQGNNGFNKPMLDFEDLVKPIIIHKNESKIDETIKLNKFYNCSKFNINVNTDNLQNLNEFEEVLKSYEIILGKNEQNDFKRESLTNMIANFPPPTVVVQENSKQLIIDKNNLREDSLEPIKVNNEIKNCNVEYPDNDTENLDQKYATLDKLNDYKVKHDEEFGLNAFPDEEKTVDHAVDDDSDCEGYHSSDFEFITESDAELDGLFKVAQKIETQNDTLAVNTVKMPKDKEIICSSHNLQQKTIRTNGTALKTREYFRNLKTQYDFNEINKSRVNHQIPEDENYLNLFRGFFIAPTADVFMENKSVIPTTYMSVHYEGLGFDMRMMRQNSNEQEQYQQEASESAKKILDLYPRENRKRRRFK